MFHPLKVRSIRPLTPEAKAVTFEVPYELRGSFAFKAGQYVTIEIELDGEKLRRPYSISSPTHSEDLTVGVKQVPGGRFTSYVLHSLIEGTTLHVSEPEGRFVYEYNGSPEQVLLVAAGSGITPILSIVHEVLRSDFSNRCLLLYGNRSPEESMFREDLLELKRQYPERFIWRDVYSRVGVEGADFGRIDRGLLLRNARLLAPVEEIDRAYLCGPQPMIEDAKQGLLAKGMPEAHILHELFTAPPAPAETVASAPVREGVTAATVILDGMTHQLTFPTGGFLLDEILKAGLDAPYSCQGGICSSCVAKVSGGSAPMVKNQILTDAEVQEGLVLTCQARCDSPEITVDYDDV